MQLFFTNQRKVRKVGQVAGLDAAALSDLFNQRRLPAGAPILLDAAMRPVEPISSWFRKMALDGRDPKTMRSYAYTAVMLLNFLASRRLDYGSAGETDIHEFRIWRCEQAPETVSTATWDRDSAAIALRQQCHCPRTPADLASRTRLAHRLAGRSEASA